ncbi:MAG: hypothetical protein ACI4VK_04625 [Candidatus Coproplasma sp.]
MKDNRTEEAKVTANAAEAENTGEVVVGPKKFKDVQALIDAYTALEAEFTRRSQRLKELEANKEQVSSADAAGAQVAPTVQATSDTPPSQAEAPEGEVRGYAPANQGEEVRPLTEEEKNAVIEEYLSGIRSNRSVPFVTAGGAVKASRVVPRTISEASSLAKRYFDKKEN